MKKHQIKILAIETSCDETSAAVISCANFNHQDTITKQYPTSKSQSPDNNETDELGNGRPIILSNVVSSQIDLHAKTGGVVPEVASRAHMEAMIPVIEQALFDANQKSQILNSKQIKNPNSLNIENSNLEFVSNLGFSASDLLQDITHIAVTVGPGLIGSLLVGFNTAKALAYALDLPIIPVNHIEGHIYSAIGGTNSKLQIPNSKQTQNPKYKTKNFSDLENLDLNIVSDLGFGALDFPVLALTVSGGHTSLTLMKDHGVYENIGQTLDDAAGEAFDKVAKLLGLGYPGGPAVSKIAEQFRNRITNNQISITKQIPNTKSKMICHSGPPIRPKAGFDPESIKIDSRLRGNDIHNSDTYKLKAESSINLPLPLARDNSCNFSFSGLKTAVINVWRKAEREYQNNPEKLADFKVELAAVFEETATAHLIDKTLKAAKKYQPKSIILAGGVSANNLLRSELAKKLQATSYKLIMPPMELTGDNAAMIGIAAYYHIQRGQTKNWNDIKVDSNLKL